METLISQHCFFIVVGFIGMDDKLRLKLVCKTINNYLKCLIPLISDYVCISLDSSVLIPPKFTFVDHIIMPTDSLQQFKNQKNNNSFYLYNYGHNLGWGLNSSVVIKCNTPLMVYSGEMINTQERRRRQKHRVLFIYT